MLQCAFPVFLLMLGATLIGGWLSWLIARKNIVDNSEEIPQLKNEIASLQDELNRISEYSSTFHSDKRILKEENKTLAERLNALQGTVNKLTKDKAFLISEFNRVNQDLEKAKEQQELHFAEGMEVTEAEQSTDDSHLNQQILEAQLQDIQTELMQWKTKYEALQDSLSRKEQRVMELGEIAKETKSKKKKKKWEMRYKKLKLKLVAVTKERDAAYTELKHLKATNDQLLTELTDTKNKVHELPVERKKTKEEVFDRIKKRKDLLDFRRLGKFNAKQKDDLKKISGVGPFIEKKLNALGIFKFEQLAKLTDDDISEIIKIIEVPSGIIKGADWIEQAKNMK